MNRNSWLSLILFLVLIFCALRLTIYYDANIIHELGNIENKYVLYIFNRGLEMSLADLCGTCIIFLQIDKKIEESDNAIGYLTQRVVELQAEITGNQKNNNLASELLLKRIEDLERLEELRN